MDTETVDLTNSKGKEDMEEIPIVPLDELHSQISNHLEKLSEMNKTVITFELPKSQFAKSNFDVEFRESFKKPDSDELKVISRDENNNQLRLSNQQLSDIRKTGSFFVPSNEFQGQSYRWVINKGFQKGTYHIGETFKDGIALATEMFIIWIPNRIWKGTSITIWDSLKSIVIGFVNTLTLPFGWIATEKSNVNSNFDLEDIRIDWLLNQIFDSSKYNNQNSSFATDDGITVNLFTTTEEQVLSQIRDSYDAYMKDFKASQLQNRKKAMKDLTTSYPNDTQQNLLQLLSDMEVQQQQQAVYEFINNKLNGENQKEIACKIQDFFNKKILDKCN